MLSRGCDALTSITLGKTPPTTWQAGTVYGATIYVPHDAVGYSDTFEGMPVIRATESADNFYLGGKTLEDRFLIKANAETIYTGAVCPASSGTQYYWDDWHQCHAFGRNIDRRKARQHCQAEQHGDQLNHRNRGGRLGVDWRRNDEHDYGG